MKWFLLVLVVLASLLVFSPTQVFATDPQPYQYAMIKCAGLGIAELQIAEQLFDTAYGWQHHLTTYDQWVVSYAPRVNEFAWLHGCPKAIGDDGQLTSWYRTYVPIYQADLGLSPYPPPD